MYSDHVNDKLDREYGLRHGRLDGERADNEEKPERRYGKQGDASRLHTRKDEEE